MGNEFLVSAHTKSRKVIVGYKRTMRCNNTVWLMLRHNSLYNIDDSYLFIRNDKRALQGLPRQVSLFQNTPPPHLHHSTVRCFLNLFLKTFSSWQLESIPPLHLHGALTGWLIISLKLAQLNSVVWQKLHNAYTPINRNWSQMKIKRT